MGTVFEMDQNLGTIEVESIVPSKNGLVDFCLETRLRIVFRHDVDIESFSAELWVRRHSAQLFVGRMEIAAEQPPYSLSAQSRTRRMMLRLPLSARQMTALDDARQGSSAQLVVETWLGYRFADNRQPGCAHTQLDLRMAASDWLDKMREMGAVDVFSMSVYVPYTNEAIADIVKNLRHAQEELYAGRRPREIATYVRKALESFTAWQNDRDQVNQAGNEGFANLTGKSVDHRLRLARRAVHGLVVAAPHENDVEYDIPTARASVGMAIALLEAYVDRSANRT